MRSFCFGLLVLCLWPGILPAEDRGASAYDPLAHHRTEPATVLDLTVRDENRKRDVPIRIYYCGKIQTAPVILFSHGLGGSREGSRFLGEHWAARGYIAVFLQHRGSDTAVWKDQRLGQRIAAMKAAASPQNFLLRAQDVTAVLDQLESWNRDSSHSLSGSLDLERIGMSGHSFGAVTTQAVSGQSLPRGGSPLIEPRITAALPMSPSVPAFGEPQAVFGSVQIPWMLMTGTHDHAPIGNATPENRRLVYPALPVGGKYELVLHQAEHSVFTDRPLPGEQTPRNPQHHRVILALSSAFWDTYLKGDPPAKAWLDGDGPRTVLEEKDLWQRK